MQSTSASPFSTVVGLGAPRSQHPVKALTKRGNLGCGAISLLIAPALGGFAVYDLWDAYDRYGPRGMNREFGTAAVIGGLGLAALLLAAWLLYSAWKNWGSAVAVYEAGLAYVDRAGLRQVRWDEIDAVWQAVTKHYRNGIYTGTTHVYTLQPRAGGRLVLDDKFDKIEDLGTALQRSASAALFPRYAEALKRGERVTFGPLALDPQGLYAGNKSLKWDEIKGVKLEKGTLSVKKEGGWFNWTSATVPQIPNFFVFYDLLSRFTKVE